MPAPRRERAFVTLNCAALAEGLLDSELFGHVRGAFTGAVSDRTGLFEAAHGGTLFLDETADMPKPMQAKLLRVLQCGEVRPVGANTARQVDVRLICATHQALPELVAAGSFREDLYYRVSTFTLRLPPLRERRADITALLAHFGRSFADLYGRASRGDHGDTSSPGPEDCEFMGRLLKSAHELFQ